MSVSGRSKYVFQHAHPNAQEAKIKELNENFSKQVEDLQKLYEGYMKDKEAAEAALKGQGLGLAKAVRKSLEAKTDEL